MYGAVLASIHQAVPYSPAYINTQQFQGSDIADWTLETTQGFAAARPSLVPAA